MRDWEEEVDVDTAGERSRKGERKRQKCGGWKRPCKLPDEQDLGFAVNFDVRVIVTCEALSEMLNLNCQTVH